MKDIVLASYRTNTEADIEADLIVNNEACSFIELITVGGGVQAIDDGMKQLMQKPSSYWRYGAAWGELTAAY